MIYIIRHGQTEMNNRKVLQGRSEHPLNDHGVRQAAEAAEKLKEVTFEKVFSSPLIRARQTAELIVPSVPAVRSL